MLYRDWPHRPVVDCDGNAIPWPREVLALSAFDPLEGETQPRPLLTVVAPDVLARDARRKADLLALRDRLVAYRRQHGRFPCPGDGVWAFSSAGPEWIADLAPDCGAAPPGDLGALPVDPVNAQGPFWGGALAYGYRAYRAGCPEPTRGQFFVLGARLENRRDPLLGRQPRDCTGETIPWPDDVYAITSDD